MGKLKFSFACSDVDRMQALINGTVEPEGMDFNLIPLEVEEIYWRQLRHYEWDATEMSLSSYLLATEQVGSPIFIQGMFKIKGFGFKKAVAECYAASCFTVADRRTQAGSGNHGQ